MQYIKDMDVSGKRVLVRVDFNVPLDDSGRITDDTRIRYALPTINHLLDNNAAVIVCSHLGRPKGKEDPALSLAPVARRLEELTGRKVTLAGGCVGSEVLELAAKLAAGEILMLENLRFHPGEADNDEGFAKELASLCDIYVNDAFAVSHRANASVEAITKFVPACAAGFLLQKELESFDRALKNPKRPLVAVIGGAKVSTKLTALYNLLDCVDKLIIGGAMANTFLHAKGMGMGRSKVETDLVKEASNIIETAGERNVPVLLPVDVVVARSAEGSAETSVVPVDGVPQDTMALDIGDKTRKVFADAIAGAQTIVWNGPMGMFEVPPFDAGTNAVARAIAESGAFTVAGGGDTVSAVNRAGVAERISYISTGGGAFLELMEGKTLPGVAALERC